MANQFSVNIRNGYYYGGKDIGGTGIGGYTDQEWVTSSTTPGGALTIPQVTAFGAKILTAEVTEEDTIEICFTVAIDPVKEGKTSLSGVMYAAAYRCNTGDGNASPVAEGLSSAFTLDSGIRILGHCGSITLSPEIWRSCDLHIVFALQITAGTIGEHCYVSYGIGMQTP